MILLHRTLAVAVATIAVASTAVAQRSPSKAISLSAVVVAANHHLFGNPLAGGAATFIFPIGARVTSRFGVERVSGVSHRTGSPCAGLVQPGTCAPEPLRDAGSLSTVSAGLAVGLVRAPRLALDFALDARAGGASVDTRGVTSGRQLAANDLLIGGELSLEAAWFPLARLPLAIEAGVGAGGLGPLTPNRVDDGYTPFQNGFRLSRFRVGLAWRGLGR